MVGFTLTPVDGSTLTTLMEGANTVTFALVLDGQPGGNVVLDLSTTSSAVTLSDTSVSFIPSAWNTPVMVTVTSRVDNNNIDGDAAYTITVGVNAGNTADAAFDALAAQTLSGTVLDNDMVGFTLTPVDGSTLPALVEGANTVTFALVLDGQPGGNVVLDLSTTSSAVTLSDASVTFMLSAWNTPVMVTVTSRVDNDNFDGDVDYTITVAVNAGTTDDDAFDVLAAQTLSGTVADDDESEGLTKDSEVQVEVAVAVADTFGTAQLAADLISTRLQAPLVSAPQVSFAGRELHAQGNIPVLVNPVASDPWGDEEEQIQDWNSDFASLLPGTDFVLPLSGSDSAGNQLEFWGSVGYTDLQGDPTVDGVKIDYDGDATGVQVGLSRRDSSGTSLGISVGSTKVDLDLEGKESGDIVKVEARVIVFSSLCGLVAIAGLGSMARRWCG